MEIDFRFLHKMCAVGTKGADEWQVIGNYYVSYSKDRETFTYSSVFGSRYVSGKLTNQLRCHLDKFFHIFSQSWGRLYKVRLA